MFAIFNNPPEASNFARGFENLFDILYYTSLALFIATVLALAYFSIKYRRGKSDPDSTPYISGHRTMETAVMALLFVFLMVIFYWGWVDYKKMREHPSDALEISVTAQTWSWSFTYPNGRVAPEIEIPEMNKRGTSLRSQELVVPRGKPIKLVMSSIDVLHSFYVPAFRIKQDVIPNTYTSVWFNATQTGVFDMFCAEYCGLDHSMMMAKVRVVEPEEYAKWQKAWEWEKQTGISTAYAFPQENKAAAQLIAPVEKGKQLLSSKGCTSCHAVDGSRMIGPPLNGLFGKEVELEGGGKAMADENYLRESIVDPSVKVVKGFSPQMPVYRGSLKDEEIGSIIAYIKSLK